MMQNCRMRRLLFLVFVVWVNPLWAAHGYALWGNLKYPAGFDHFDYVNPGAPKGGELRLERAVRRDVEEHVLRLEVPVEDAHRVEVGHRLAQREPPFLAFRLPHFVLEGRQKLGNVTQQRAVAGYHQRPQRPARRPANPA